MRIIIIGAGPGGYETALLAAKRGVEVVLIESGHVGGTCLNEGCIPSKALLNSGKLYEHAKESEVFGVTAENVKIDHAKVVDRKDKVVKMLVSGVGATMKAHKVNVVMAEGVIKGKTADGFVVTANGEEYAADKLILACGSVAVVPPIPGLREGLADGFVMTNQEILDMRTVPKHLTVIGGGVIGLELASYFSMVGVEVTVIEMLDKIAGPTEKEVSATLLKQASIFATKTLGENGFVIKSSAPSLSPFIISSSASLAEIIKVGIECCVTSLILLKKSKPLIPGKFKSKRNRAGMLSFCISSNACSAVKKIFGKNFAFSR